MPKIGRRRIAAALEERVAAGVPLKELSQEIAAYLLAERRTAELNSLMRDIMELRAEHGIVEVTAVTAHPLTPEATSNITKQVKVSMPQAKRVIVSEELDQSVVGGVKLEFANQQLDLSVRNTLNRFKQLTARKV
ncbi:MAG: synthase delta subunit [Candidatus Saccharibacteria bacterium]|nr:synthase delta subunit [Candidatus Saccharibacteria bacterium]